MSHTKSSYYKDNNELFSLPLSIKQEEKISDANRNPTIGFAFISAQDAPEEEEAIKSLLVALRPYLDTPCVNRDAKVLCTICLSAKDVPWGLF